MGTHLAHGRLGQRIRQHYGRRHWFGGDKNKSVFRRHVGAALMRRDDPFDPRLPGWLRHNGPSDPEVEVRVSDYLARCTTFVCVRVDLKDDRLELEQGLIALFGGSGAAAPSANWLGLHSPYAEVRASGFWNTRGVGGEPLTEAELERFKRAVTRTRMG